MKRKKSIIVVVALLIGIIVPAISIDTPQDIAAGFNQGKAELISKYFKGSVELTIDSKENVYSSTQAEIILKDFFNKNTPQSFTVLHEGGKDDSKYIIGTLKTIQGSFRITILLKTSETRPYIHQLRIEKNAV